MRVLLAILMITLSVSCATKKKKASTVPTPTPEVVQTPAATPAATPAPTAPIVLQPPVTATPEPEPPVVETDPIPEVIFDPWGAPILPTTPLVPDPHVILTTGEVLIVDPRLIGANLCVGSTVSAYYQPCGVYLCARVQCGYFVCRR